MKIKYLIGGIVIVGFVIMAAVTLKSTMTPYVTFKQAQQMQSPCQVKGSVVPGSARYEAESKLFKFRLQDDENNVVLVEYNGVKPGNFDQAKYVVVMGRYVGKFFKASQILVKCPSKYEAEGVNK